MSHGDCHVEHPVCTSAWQPPFLTAETFSCLEALGGTEPLTCHYCFRAAVVIENTSWAVISSSVSSKMIRCSQMSQERPPCSVLWWKEVTSVPTEVQVPTIPCAWFYYSSWIFCLLLWSFPSLNYEICEARDNILLIFYPTAWFGICLMNASWMSGWKVQL